LRSLANERIEGAGLALALGASAGRITMQTQGSVAA
jgi:hypothetical protein